MEMKPTLLQRGCPAGSVRRSAPARRARRGHGDAVSRATLIPNKLHPCHLQCPHCKGLVRGLPGAWNKSLEPPAVLMGLDYSLSELDVGGEGDFLSGASVAP